MRAVDQSRNVATLEEIQQRGWCLKSWTTRHGELHAGRAFDRHSLVRLLSNVLYVGAVQYQGKVYRGEQSPIVERKIWQRAKRFLEQEHGREHAERNRQGAVLKKLLRCAGCGKAMVPGYTARQGRRYSYYVCRTAQKHGARACAGGLVSKERIEAAVADALYELAGAPQGESLRQRLPPDRVCWDGLESSEQHKIMKMAVEEILYDRHSHEGRLRVRADVAGEGGEEIMIYAGRRPLVQQAAPESVERPAVTVMEGGLPRITKLMALAIRMEGLLQEGVAKDYADLARLGGVSRSRITQILNLRNLAPALQERLLQLPEGGNAHGLTEGALRQISGLVDWREQIVRFNHLLG